jgi:hypothetical protein
MSGLIQNDRRAQLLLLALALVPLCGCGKGEGDDSEQGESGGRQLVRFSASVNGLTVLGDMFTAAGHTVSLRKELSPVLQEAADVVVWAPDDFNVPDAKTCDLLDRWLRDKEDRTLIYIGRDFDARPLYWRKILAKAPPVDRTRDQKELDESEAMFQSQRATRPQKASCSWFDLDGQAAHRDIRSLDGPWAEGIDASKIEIELNSRLNPSDDADILLADGDDSVLVSRQSFSVLNPKVRWQPGTHVSHLLVVANGSFLYNVPLVNHEHRKLAGRLIDEVGKAKHVVILDSQNHHPISLAGDKNNPPDQTPQSMLDVFDVWPLSAILVQWGILIVLLCFAKWPIFGPPRDPPPPPASDFGRHVAALGAAMAVTGDAEYAQSRVQQYRQLRDATGSRAINRTNTKRT